MGAVTVGPLMFAAERLAAVAGIAAFLVVATLISLRAGPQLATWAWRAMLIGLVAARVGHVLVHWPNFVEEPLRVFAVWQGGFFWPLGVLAAALALLFFLDRSAQRWLALASLAFGLLVWSMGTQLGAPVDAKTLPQASFPTIEGRRLDVAGMAGEPTVLNLWASWCPPCRREMPMMADMAAARPDVRFVFANQGEDRDQVAAFLADQGLTLETVLLDSLGELSRHYGTPGLPATLFIDAGGTLRDVHLGEISRETLNEKIARLTGAQEGVSLAGYR